METSYDRDANHLRLDFGSSDEVASFVEVARRESGFLVTLPVGLSLHQTVAVELFAEETSSTVTAKVVQVFDKGTAGFSTALLVDDWAAFAIPRGHKDAVGSDPGHDGPGDLGNGAEPAGNEGEMRGTSPIHAIKEMNPRQRALLAMKASRTQRRVLLRDNSPLVLQSLLVNPHIDSEEVLQIARSSHVVAPILQRIAGDARWGSNQEILGVVARHPKTPSSFAARLMPTLRTSDLRTMARMSSGLREMTRKAALREYMRRTGQRV